MTTDYAITCLTCGWAEDAMDVAALPRMVLAHLVASPRCRSEQVEIRERQFELTLDGESPA